MRPRNNHSHLATPELFSYFCRPSKGYAGRLRISNAEKVIAVAKGYRKAGTVAATWHNTATVPQSARAGERRRLLFCGVSRGAVPCVEHRKSRISSRRKSTERSMQRPNERSEVSSRISFCCFIRRRTRPRSSRYCSIAQYVGRKNFSQKNQNGPAMISRQLSLKSCAGIG